MAAAPLPPVSAPVPAPEPARLSEGARLVNTFIAPSKTFTDLGRNASWWGPWLVISIFALLFIYSMDRQIGFDQISRNEIAHSPQADQFDKLSPDDQERRLRFSDTLVRYLSYGIPVTILVFLAISTAVLWATFNFGMGANLSYKTAVSMFAGVNPEGFNVNNPVATNPAYFMDRAGNKFLYGMASSLDILVIWTIVLMGIGFACNSKVKRGTAIGIVAGWYLLWKLMTSALAARG
jgi:hypothetical protein